MNRSKTIIWGEYRFDITASDFDLKRFVKNEKIDHKDLYFAKLAPPLPYENYTFSYIHFQNVFVSDGNLFFQTPTTTIRISIGLNALNSLTIEIVDPSMSDDEIPRNYDLAKVNNKLFAQIFSDGEYLGSTESKWSKLLIDLRTMLKSNHKGSFGILVGIRDKETRAIEYFEARNFFKGRSGLLKFGKKVMIMNLKSRKRLSFKFMGKTLYADEASKPVQGIIYQAYELFDHCHGTALNALARRIVNVSLNGGIAVNFFEKDILAPFAELYGQSHESTVLRLGQGINEISDYSIKEEFGLQLDDFKNNIFYGSNEQAYRSLFWDPIIAALFRDESENPKTLLSPRWNCTGLIREIDARFSDYAVLIRINSLLIPILIVEIGSDIFDVDNLHKDATKLINTMILTCFELATELEKAGKSSGHARVYGLWIGGSRAQMVVAHPVITPLGSTHEIHVNVTFHDHWLVDVLTPTELGTPSVDVCSEPCCRIINEIIPGPMEFIKHPMSVNPVISEQFSPIINAENISVDEVTEPERVAVPTTEPHLLSENSRFDLSALKKIKVFSRIVKDRIEFLNSESSNRPEGPAKRFKERENLHIDKSRYSSSTNTPFSSQVSESHHPSTPKSPTLNVRGNRPSGNSSTTFRIRKSSPQEFTIYKRLALYPIYFPKLYSSKSSKHGGFVYKFERMQPLIQPHKTRLNLPVLKNYADKFMQALTFSIHCIHGLYLLHEVLGIVHSDISPRNIMFSNLHKVWKINDFDHSMSIEESKRTKRAAGTRGYIAPESVECKIFTNLSDIYALGKIIQELFYFEILSSFSWKYGDGILSDHLHPIDKLNIETFYFFEGIVYEMVRKSPEKRPTSAKAILTRLFNILRRFKYNKRDSIFLSVKNIVSLEVNSNVSEAEPVTGTKMIENTQSENIRIVERPKAQNIIARIEEKTISSTISNDEKENLEY